MTTKAQFHIDNWFDTDVQLPAPMCDIGGGVWLFDDGSRLLYTGGDGLVELSRVVAIRWNTPERTSWSYRDIADVGTLLKQKDDDVNVEFLEIAK